MPTAERKRLFAAATVAAVALRSSYNHLVSSCTKVQILTPTVQKYKYCHCRSSHLALQLRIGAGDVCVCVCVCVCVPVCIVCV